MKMAAYTYAEVETAVAAALDARAHQRGALRGRLKHFQRLGLLDLKAKKGQRVEYNCAQAAQWLIALVLAETGMDPTLIVATLKQSWKRIASEIEQATSRDAESGRFTSYLCLSPRVLSAAFEQKPSAATLYVIQLMPQTPGLASNELLDLIASHKDTWFCSFNLTRLLIRLRNNLPYRRG
jgi:hypothetical protein